MRYVMQRRFFYSVVIVAGLLLFWFGQKLENKLVQNPNINLSNFFVSDFLLILAFGLVVLGVIFFRSTIGMSDVTQKPSQLEKDLLHDKIPTKDRSIIVLYFIIPLIILAFILYKLIR